MSDDDEDQPEEILGKRGKKGQKNKPLPETPDEIEALIRRQKRNLRKAWAEGYLTAITAMLKPGDLAVDCGANMGVVTERLAATGADVVAFELNAAVGVGSGTVRLMRADNFGDNPEGASVKSTILDGGRRIDAENAVEVPLIDFPSWVADQVKARGEVAFIKMDIEGAELDILEKMDAEQLFQNVRCLVAETHERKFKDLRDRYKALRDKVSESYAPGKVNLDWI
ncbi:MAG: hypothetical protein RI979_2414 [Pseudomonadota bacterium]